MKRERKTRLLKAKLVLQDNTVFTGYSFGYEASVSGEVVFNTGMTGYPESFTDPSYKGQMLVMSYPIIGNYGVMSPRKSIDGVLENFESEKIHLAGLIVQSYSNEYSHWSATKSLGQWLQEQHVPAIQGIDTRALTKKLRQQGVMLGKIIIDDEMAFQNPYERNLVAEVSIKKKKRYGKGKYKIILVDCGVKHNIINELLSRNMTVMRVPWDYDFTEEDFDGVFISNGPGNPKLCKATIHHLQKAMNKQKPIFGICLGNQLLALAAGGDTYKLKYGHRSQNQPCVETRTERCYITSQNHGYAVRTKNMSRDWKEWFVNANDRTNEGIIHNSELFMGTQFHIEHCPGPQDTAFLFDKFVKNVQKCAQAKK